MSYISLSYGLEFLTPVMAGDYFRQNCGGPSNWFVHRSKDPDFIQKLANDKVKIVKPMITISYNSESYLYVFYLTTDDETSIIHSKIQYFESMGYKFHQINEMSYAVLTDDLLEDYDGESECVLDEEGNIIEDDEVGGTICFSKIE